MPTRKEILEMLSAGQIDVTRATEMLGHAGEPESPPPPPEPPAAPVAEAPRPKAPVEKSGRRWLHIHVSNLDSGKSRVRVNVPLGLVQFGLKIGARFTDEVDTDMMHDVVDALQSEEITGTLVEVEDVEDNERVHIFVD
jgi:hypothetical protein